MSEMHVKVVVGGSCRGLIPSASKFWYVRVSDPDGWA
jgi:hypothetical protein